MSAKRMSFYTSKKADNIKPNENGEIE
jgi:hypothetical protein